MKMINWSMGEAYMIGSYIQYFLLLYLIPPAYWYIGVVISMIIMFIIGCLLELGLLKRMFIRVLERRDEYITVMTLAWVILFRNIMAYLYGPYVYSTPEYFSRVTMGTLPISGSRFMACIGTVVILAIFWYVIKYTWIGRAFRAVAQNRLGAYIVGINSHRIDTIAFGIGTALAGAAGALLAPVYLVYPTNGSIATMKGFEIIVIGGLGSIAGSVIAGILLGIVEIICSALISTSYRDIYGFVFLLLVLAIKPTGFFGEEERLA